MIKSEIVDGVAILTLAHGKANALDIELCNTIADSFTDLRNSRCEGGGVDRARQNLFCRRRPETAE